MNLAAHAICGTDCCCAGSVGSGELGRQIEFLRDFWEVGFRCSQADTGCLTVAGSTVGRESISRSLWDFLSA